MKKSFDKIKAKDYFEIIATQQALKYTGSIIAKEILTVMLLTAPWNTSQKWGKYEVYANIHDFPYVFVKDDELMLLEYRNGTIHMIVGDWISEIRNFCIYRIIKGMYEKGFKDLKQELINIDEVRPSFIS